MSRQISFVRPDDLALTTQARRSHHGGSVHQDRGILSTFCLIESARGMSQMGRRFWIVALSFVGDCSGLEA